MAKLSARERAALPASAFVFPETREFPIPDRPHAYDALRMAGKEPASRAAIIQAEVVRRFGIGASGATVQPVAASTGQ
jgi:hypothetical protein